MNRRYLLVVLAFVLIAASVLTYLIQTGERGLGRQARPTRSLGVIQLDATKIKNLGWDAKGLDVVFNYAASLSTDSFMIITDAQRVGAFGDLSKPYSIHSIRKPLLSALFGQKLASPTNKLRLDATLLELGIDDAPISLTELQRQTTVRHLLHSVSGINHPAAAWGSLQADIDRRLGHTENQLGTIWAYNNWDYNALTTVFENTTGSEVAEAFDIGIAQPVGMQDFERSAVSYTFDPQQSEHRAAMFKMSLRDLARIGNLYLNRGLAGRQHILEENWTSLITSDFTEIGLGGLRGGHGYLWWIPSPETGLPEGTFWAWGLGNQALIVIPEWNTIVIHQSDTIEFLKRFISLISSEKMTGEEAIEQLILSCREAATRETEYCIEHRFISRCEFKQLISLVVAARE
ncbi:CubicO group peptidase, beta-lactamase class C family [Pseudovibrio ascidiaceicola]|uniref:CubicO group peptidase, beta-lactamase class C family n=1 Tax=Pseudovibrio ascidiaceicola TaxID=285279 RepID=A0A1I3YJ11_9HYPH|nr:serine hydrolase [Pseudovibrio ascidiaceicola]SFK31907.1 CubicO group peptidase, beta-lactamase class C family [Pseudovibrio ascidiaceicola]